MKMQKFILGLLLTFLFLSCDDDKKIPLPEEPSLTLSKLQIAINNKEVLDTLLVESSSDWTIENAKTTDWCSVEKKGADSLFIMIDENHTFVDRATSVKIKNADKTMILPISQEGVKRETTLDWYTLAVNSTTGILKKEGNQYRILANKLFINPKMREKIFHGSILNKTLDRSAGLEHFADYTYNPITFSTLSNGKLFSEKDILPSFEITNGLAEKIIEDQPKQNESFIYSSPYQFNSYKHLRMLGLGNLGLKLDEIINGKPYTEIEMENTVGLIYSYSYNIFNIVMDYPYNSLIKETLDEELANKLAYVNAVSYGRTAFLVIESPYNFKLSKVVARKIMLGEAINGEEKKVAESLKATYIFFKENGEIEVDKSADVIKKYFAEIENQPIIPLNFSTTDYKTNGVGDMEVVFDLP